MSGSVSAFVGTWKPVSGTLTVMCVGANSTTTQVTAFIVWQAGVAADIVQVQGDCSIQADVSGLTATALPGQSCDQSDGDAIVATSYSAYNFVLSADGHAATENRSGTITTTTTDSMTLCTYSESAAYQKIAN